MTARVSGILILPTGKPQRLIFFNCKYRSSWTGKSDVATDMFIRDLSSFIIDKLASDFYPIILIFAARLRVGAVAQLVEQWTENPCVAGSTPAHTTKKPQFIAEVFLFYSF